MWLRQKVGVTGQCSRFCLTHTRLNSNFLPHKTSFYISSLACELRRSFKRLAFKTYSEASVCKMSPSGAGRGNKAFSLLNLENTCFLGPVHIAVIHVHHRICTLWSTSFWKGSRFCGYNKIYDTQWSFRAHNPFLQVQILSLAVAQKCVLLQRDHEINLKIGDVSGQKNSSFKCIANIAAHDLHLDFVTF